MRRLRERIRKTVHFLGEYRIAFGKDPLTVKTPALVIFPLQLSTLCCGFAGMLTIRHNSSIPEANHPDETSVHNGMFAGLFERLSVNNLNAFFNGAIKSTAYLGGREVHAKVERELLCLKENERLQKIFYDIGELNSLQTICKSVVEFLACEEKTLEEKSGLISTTDLEEINRGIIMLRDVAWGIEKDIIDNVEKICALAGTDETTGVLPASLHKYRKLNFLLNSLDRLEVRGRDSAGIQISFLPENQDDIARILSVLEASGLSEEMKRRTTAGDSVDGSITISPSGASLGTGHYGSISFTYKTAEIIGELGRNVRKLRQQIAGDAIFRLFAALPATFETAFTHTRWASVGSITEENCHPIGNYTLPEEGKNVPEPKTFPCYGSGFWTINVVLNGDIDNYQPLRDSFCAKGGRIAPELTTDTKIIPLRIEHHLRTGQNLTEAFRLSVRDFEGSHAIAMVSNLEPGKVFLALRGSGQSIYVGIAADRYLFSSELYGLVEETPFFIKMDGERESVSGTSAGKGQIFILDQDVSGGVEGITAFHYDQSPVLLTSEDVKRAEITTRDIDRGAQPHYFLKEIEESALSVRKTLMGKYRIEKTGQTETAFFSLGEDVVPDEIREGLKSKTINRIYVIGHGTAAVAGYAVADALKRHLNGSGITVLSLLASELSGFSLERDLHDTLVVPITQSGTTTDTNRAVAMARDRGAKIIAIVNRRQSDITMKADGVFYTSDGRDIEMAVASTKAFYSQIIAGNVLALALASMLATLSGEETARELRVLETAPDLMKQALAQKEKIRDAVEKTIRNKRYWAIVGSGPNKAASDEIRIKLSELCYLTISSDVVENKKHIDLSAEPLIVVCAAGSPESVVGDIVKDVAIFKAHKSSVVVFAEEGERRFDAIADAVIPIPRAPLPLPTILNTVAGHLFGYYAACAIDEDALYLRTFKNRLNFAMVDQARRNVSVYESFNDKAIFSIVNHFTVDYMKKMNQGHFSQGGVRTITDLSLLLKYAGGRLPLDDFRHDFPDSGEMAPVDLLDAMLGHAVDELSRPIDAIRHQAKTVTVGTSRKETLPQGPVSDLLRQLAIDVHSLLSTNVLLLDRLQKAVLKVNGYTLYAVDRLEENGRPKDDSTISILKRGGISAGMHSRVEESKTLIGTKKGIVASGRVYAGQGKTDGAQLLIVPLLGEKEHVSNLLLLHVSFNENLTVKERIEIIGKKAYEIRNLIQECNLFWDENMLAALPVGLLLGESSESIVSRLRAGKETYCDRGN